MNTIHKDSTNIAAMFNCIAPHYDFLNHLLSLNIDKLWRKKLVSYVVEQRPATILDVATGTGDLAIALHCKTAAAVTGTDIAVKMLDIAKCKLAMLNNKPKLREQHTIDWILASAEALPFAANTFDAVTTAFGARNFENITGGLQNMYRVLKPNGCIAVLEFAIPVYFPVKQLYCFYFQHILPFVGRMLSKHLTAYDYLPASVNDFPQRENFLRLLEQIGFVDAQYQSLSCGIAMIYTAYRR